MAIIDPVQKDVRISVQKGVQKCVQKCSKLVETPPKYDYKNGVSQKRWAFIREVHSQYYRIQ